MRIVKLCLMTGLAFGLPCAAGAQQYVAKATRSDIHYCHALSLAYSGMYPANEGMNVADSIALGGCDTDTQKTIATLERMLKDQKIELPPRGVARAPALIDGTPCRGEPTATSCSDYGP
jgi:hypothetical protein